MMDFVALFKFAVNCFDFLAWPLFALGYPLCASIEAIETNSNSDTQKLITYWISFSLILLFERAFVRLLDWLPFWPYIKLIIVCCLVIPRFDGSLYVYKHLVHPCLTLDPKIFIKKFKKLKAFLKKLKAFLEEDNLLVEEERHKKENELDAVENVTAFKPKCEEPKLAHKDNTVQIIGQKEVASTKQCKFDEPKIAHKDANAVEITEKNEVTSTKQPKFEEPKVAQKDANAVQVIEKKEVTSTKQHKFEEPKVAHKDAKAAEVTEKNEVTSTKQVGQTEPSSLLAENRTFAPLGIKEMATALEGSWYTPEIPPSKKVQKEWTCAICQVTTTSETDLHSHLQGNRHKAACEELKTKNQTLKSKVSPASSGKKSNVPMGTGAVSSNDFPDKPPPKIIHEWTCAMCQVTSKSEKDFQSHLQGSRHRAACDQLKAKKQTLKSKVTTASEGKKSNMPDGKPEKKGTSPENTSHKSKKQGNQKIRKGQGVEIRNSLWWCTICNISCTSEGNMDSHLNGSRHLARTRELNGLGGSGHV